jgi:hypothetical protein
MRIIKSCAVQGLERGTSFVEVCAPYLQATPAASSTNIHW